MPTLIARTVELIERSTSTLLAPVHDREALSLEEHRALVAILRRAESLLSMVFTSIDPQRLEEQELSPGDFGFKCRDWTQDLDSDEWLHYWRLQFVRAAASQLHPDPVRRVECFRLWDLLGNLLGLLRDSTDIHAAASVLFLSSRDSIAVAELLELTLMLKLVISGDILAVLLARGAEGGELMPHILHLLLAASRAFWIEGRSPPSSAVDHAVVELHEMLRGLLNVDIERSEMVGNPMPRQFPKSSGG